MSEEAGNLVRVLLLALLEDQVTTIDPAMVEVHA